MPNYVKNYYYHISTQLSAKDKILKPKWPGANHGDNEPYLKRICVCPTIAGCLSAVAPCLDRNKVKIFRTINKVNGYYPFCPNSYKNPFRTRYPVADAAVTGEKWILTPVKFKYIGYMVVDELPDEILYGNVGWDDPDVLKDQRRTMCYIARLLKSGRIKIYKKRK